MVCHAYGLCRAGHELHQALRACAGDGLSVTAAFRMNNAGQQINVDVVGCAGTR